MYTCSAWNKTLDGLKLLHTDKVVLWFPGWSLEYLWVDDRYWWEEVLSMSRSQDMSSTERSWDFLLLSGTIGEGGSFRIEVELVREPEASEALRREPRVPEGMQRGPGGPQGSLEGFECPPTVFEVWNGNGVEFTSTLGGKLLGSSGTETPQRESEVPEGISRGPEVLGGSQGDLEGFECPLMVSEVWSGNGVECASTLGVERLVFSGRDVSLTSVRDK